VPDGDARDLLATQPDVDLCRPDDVSAMRRVLATRIGESAPTVDRTEGVARYERAALAKELVGVYDAVLSGGRRAPGPGRTSFQPAA
jgi:hypothetical protein